MILDPTFPDVRRSAEACVIEILFLEGRTTEQKSRLFQTIVARALDAGFCSDDIMIALMENAPTDWSLAGGSRIRKRPSARTTVAINGESPEQSQAARLAASRAVPARETPRPSKAQFY